MSQCFDRPWNLFCFESGKSERDDQAMRPSFHDACLPRARLSLAEGGIRRVQMSHDRSKLRRCALVWWPIFGTLGGGAGDIFAIARPSCV